MLGLHPFLDVDVTSLRRRLMLWLQLNIRIEIVPEVLQKGDLLLEFSFRRKIAHFVGNNGVLVVLLLDVFKVFAVLVCDDFGGVVEVDAS